MTWLSFLFTFGIPLASIFEKLLMELLGGFKIPLAWTFSYYSALSTTFVLMFTFVRMNWRYNPRSSTFVIFIMFTIVVSICLGFAVGMASAKSGILGFPGVLGHPYEDPSRGKITSSDAFFTAFIGTWSGLGLGIGNSRWMQALFDNGMKISLASTICASIATVSIALALGISLFW